MGKKFLTDTNVLIDFQRNVLPKKGHEYIAEIIDNEFIVSFVSYIEFLGYPLASPSMESFIKLATVVEINKAIIDTAIAVRRKKKIKLPDAIIAATAVANGFTLISRNVSDFDNIKSLRVVNPHDL